MTLRGRSVAWATAVGFAAAFVLVFVLAVAVVAASMIGPQFPDREDLPALPDGYEMGEPTEGCGSGGCYLEAVVEPPPGTDPADAARTLGGIPTGCSANGLLDRRQRCTGVTISPTGRLAVSVQIHDLGK
jgi:hypothetical protein